MTGGRFLQKACYRVVLFAVALPLAAQSTASAVKLPDGAPAPIHLVVFSDFECPFSASMFQTLHALQARYGDRLHLVIKQSPLAIHPDAALAHQAALAAGRQGQFDAMAALLYANESQHSRAELVSYAEHLHLDVARFKHDLDSPQVRDELARDQNEAEAMGVEATPTLYLEGRKLVGIQSEAKLISLMDAGAPVPVSAASAASGPPAPLDPALVRSMIAGGETRGAVTAPLTIVEFTDFQCPFCAAAVDPLRALRETRSSDVKILYRAFPLDFHPNANLAAEAAFAAGAQGHFWDMHDLIFANQHALSAADLDRYAEQLGLNMTAFRDALGTHRFAAQVAEDRALGMKAGVSGTPTFFLNGEEVDGVRSLPELTAWIDAHKATPGTAVSPTVIASRTSPPELTIAGDASAPLILTWYTDVRSATAVSQAVLVRSLLARSRGQMRVVVAPFPAASHPDGMLAAAALMEAQKHGKFWEMYDGLTGRLDTLTTDKVVAIAAGLGLDPVAFAASLDAAQPELVSRLEEASRRGILGSPVLFFNDERVDGLQRDAFYTEILDRQLGHISVASAGSR